MEQRDRELDRLINELFHASFMSNAKWGRAFDALADSAGQIDGYRWKLVDQQEPMEDRRQPSINLSVGYFESYFGVVMLKYVEWVEIVTTESLAAISSLTGRGEFEIEPTAGGFRIYGYR
jgi:hypothetical protein